MPRILILLTLAVALAAGDAPAPAQTPAPAPTQTDAVDAFLAKVKEGGKDIATVRVPFVQEKHLAILDEPITSPGAIEISRPLKAVRWEFTGKSVMIFAHGKVRRWGAEGKEESANDPNLKSFHDQMEAFLDGDWSGLRKAFDVAVDPAGAPTMTLTPHSKDLAKYIQSIRIRFRPDYTAPAEMKLTATGGDETTYVFGEPVVGATLPEARFAGP
jgi:hypothetical protein